MFVENSTLPTHGTENCAWCGILFTKKVHQQIYCCPEHQYENEKVKAKQKRASKKSRVPCDICGRPFKQWSSRHKYCSSECAGLAYRRRYYKSDDNHIVHPPKPGIRACLAPDGNPKCKKKFWSKDKTKFVYCPSCRKFFATATEVWDEEEWGVRDARGWR